MPKPSQIVGAEALVGAVLWGAAWQACDVHYRTLGTSASEVGMNVTVVLVNVATVLFAFTPTAWLGLVVFRWRRTRDAAMVEASGLGLTASMVSLLGVAQLIQFRLAMPVLTLLGVTLVGLAILDDRVDRVGAVGQSLPLLFGWVLAAAVAITLLTWATAGRDAARLDAHGQPHGYASLFNLYARPACLEPTNAASVDLPVARAQLVLGSNDGMVVVRDFRTGTTRRLAEANFTFRTVRTAGAKCR